MLENNYLANLNERQLEGVQASGGPVLILAGAGSGKTRVLITKAAYLINELNVSPYHILAITFTNKAAGEMKERMALLAGEDVASQMWIGTFHSICLRILRMEAGALGFDHNFVIYDDHDQEVLLKSCLNDLAMDPERWKPRVVAVEISKAKNLLLSPFAFLSQADQRA